MSTATARAAAAPDKQKGRPVAGGGLSINLVNHDTETNTLAARRMQRLADRFGLSGSRARLISDLVWGGAA
jgi:hypothetical protein